MAPRQTKQSTLEEINEILKEGLRPMLDLAPIFAHFEVELQRARDQLAENDKNFRNQLAVERGAASSAREALAAMTEKCEERRLQLVAAISNKAKVYEQLEAAKQQIAGLEAHIESLREQLADPQGSKRVSSLLELDQV